MEDLKSMKKTRFIPMLLASQLVLGSSLNFTPNAKAGVISTAVEHTIDVLGTAVEHTIDVLGTAAKCLIISGAVVGTVAISTGFVLAVASGTLTDHAYTYHALKNANINIEGAQAQFAITMGQKGYQPFHMWCANKGVTSTHMPGVYEYKDCYYFLVGNQGTKLSDIKDDAIATASAIWEKVKETSTDVWENAKNFCEAGFSAMKQNTPH